MEPREARKLKVGDAVIWDGDPDDRGQVVRTFFDGLEIAWENNAPATDAIHVNDCARVSRATGEET